MQPLRTCLTSRSALAGFIPGAGSARPALRSRRWRCPQARQGAVCQQLNHAASIKAAIRGVPLRRGAQHSCDGKDHDSGIHDGASAAKPRLVLTVRPDLDEGPETAPHHHPLVEPELLFVLDSDLLPGASLADIVERSTVLAGFEVPDSRYEGWCRCRESSSPT
jgi:hypothetical protein